MARNAYYADAKQERRDKCEHNDLSWEECAHIDSKLHVHQGSCSVMLGGQLTIDRGWNYMAKSNVLTVTPHRSTAMRQVDHDFFVCNQLSMCVATTRVHNMFFALLSKLRASMLSAIGRLARSLAEWDRINRTGKTSGCSEDMKEKPTVNLMS